ncbi:synapsin-2-like [Dermacentor silvarum]|uniref:synapsin-2-like n=1 Tax=Dermacentor silvarum TaxID=543639 RepID=UPI0021015B45|nr:synapsin-2-like [Dermacentor silvarum]
MAVAVLQCPLKPTPEVESMMSEAPQPVEPTVGEADKSAGDSGGTDGSRRGPPAPPKPPPTAKVGSTGTTTEPGVASPTAPGTSPPKPATPKPAQPAPSPPKPSPPVQSSLTPSPPVTSPPAPSPPAQSPPVTSPPAPSPPAQSPPVTPAPAPSPPKPSPPAPSPPKPSPPAPSPPAPPTPAQSPPKPSPPAPSPPTKSPPAPSPPAPSPKAPSPPAQSPPVTPPPNPSPPKPTPPPLVRPPMLACTIGQENVLIHLVPPDGTCDVVFYTDVFFNDTNSKIEPLHGDTAFDVIRYFVEHYTKTTFGTSMHPGTIGQFIRNKKQDIKSAMTKLFNDKFVHFGMLNVDNIEDYDTLKDGPLQYLSIVGDFLTKPGHHCALGVGLNKGSLGEQILDKAKLAIKHFPSITIIVIKVHTDKAVYSFPLYTVSPNPDLLNLASLDYLTMVCTYSKISPDPEDVGGSYVANVTAKFLALFDTSKNVKAKIAARKAAKFPPSSGGIMAYRVDMDDYDDSCGEGEFPRVKVIKSELQK